MTDEEDMLNRKKRKETCPYPFMPLYLHAVFSFPSSHLVGTGMEIFFFLFLRERGAFVFFFWKGKGGLCLDQCIYPSFFSHTHTETFFFSNLLIFYLFSLFISFSLNSNLNRNHSIIEIIQSSKSI